MNLPGISEFYSDFIDWQTKGFNFPGQSRRMKVRIPRKRETPTKKKAHRKMVQASKRKNRRCA